MTDQLVEVPRSEWVNLRDLFKADWPLNIVGYKTVDSYLQYTAQHPSLKYLQILSLNGDWTDGTFILVVSC